MKLQPAWSEKLLFRIATDTFIPWTKPYQRASSFAISTANFAAIATFRDVHESNTANHLSLFALAGQNIRTPSKERQTLFDTNVHCFVSFSRKRTYVNL